MHRNLIRIYFASSFFLIVIWFYCDLRRPEADQHSCPHPHRAVDEIAYSCVDKTPRDYLALRERKRGKKRDRERGGERGSAKTSWTPRWPLGTVGSEQVKWPTVRPCVGM